MKKFLAILMLLAMCFSCAAMAETTDEDLAAAKTYLFMMYKDLPETTMSDYEVVGVINIGGIEFPITWTARMPQQPAELSSPADQHPEHGDT